MFVRILMLEPDLFEGLLGIKKSYGSQALRHAARHAAKHALRHAPRHHALRYP